MRIESCGFGWRRHFRGYCGKWIRWWLSNTSRYWGKKRDRMRKKAAGLGGDGVYGDVGDVDAGFVGS